MLAFFREEFPLAMAGELRDRDHQSAYRALLAEVTRQTPLDDASQRTLDWRAYRARLVEAVHRPLRSLDADKIPRFSLHDLYIPLRASVGDPPRPEDAHRPDAKPVPIRQLDDELNGWIAKADAADAVRVLSGEPGAGKSSACAMLAARLARANRRVLLVPLTRLNYGGDARAELTRFVIDRLGHDALAGIRGEGGPPLLLILDGLDELAKLGQGVAAVLSGFVGSLSHLLNEWNQGGARALLLLAGRPGAASAMEPIARADQARLHALRFRIDDGAAKRFDDPSLAALDQREGWWRRFDAEAGMPKILAEDEGHLRALTDQPLLNWLLAQLLTLEGTDKAATITGTHDLYTRLFRHVLDRVHRRSTSPATEARDNLSPEQIGRVLEEVAVAAWHAGGERSVPLPELWRRLTDAGLDGDLDRLAERTHDEALAGLLDSFFCRAHSGIEHRAVEFTHKSFGQFLTARRIVRLIDDSHRRLGRGGDRRDLEDTLARWLDLCGCGTMDRDLLDFLRAEVASPCLDTRHGTTEDWRQTLVRLFRDCTDSGMPLPSGGKLRAREAERRVRNAETALLAALNATVLAAPPEKPLEVFAPKSAGGTLHRLIGPWTERGVAPSRLSQLDLAGADLTGAGLSNANLTRADLTHAKLFRADLSDADLSDAKLFDADLTRADLTRAKLTGAGLSDAKLTGAKLFRADLTRAKLTRAGLTHADLSDAGLSGANLFGADLSGADLSGANLSGVDPSGAKGYIRKE